MLLKQAKNFLPGGLHDFFGLHRTQYLQILKIFKNCLRPQVGRHDNDGVGKVCNTSLTIGKPTIIKHLQQKIECIRMGFFDFVEQDNRVGTAAERLCQLPSFLIANITRRSTHQAAHCVLLHILAHINAGERFFIIKQHLRQRFCQLCFSHPCGTQKNK